MHTRSHKPSELTNALPMLHFYANTKKAIETTLLYSALAIALGVWAMVFYWSWHLEHGKMLCFGLLVAIIPWGDWVHTLLTLDKDNEKGVS